MTFTMHRCVWEATLETRGIFTSNLVPVSGFFNSTHFRKVVLVKFLNIKISDVSGVQGCLTIWGVLFYSIQCLQWREQPENKSCDTSPTMQVYSQKKHSLVSRKGYSAFFLAGTWTIKNCGGCFCYCQTRCQAAGFLAALGKLQMHCLGYHSVAW